jgi:hypothetical protein
MTQQITPYALVGIEGLLLVGGVWLLAHAFKTWRAESLRDSKMGKLGTVVEFPPKTAFSEPQPDERPSSLYRAHG